MATNYLRPARFYYFGFGWSFETDHDTPKIGYFGAVLEPSALTPLPLRSHALTQFS